MVDTNEAKVNEEISDEVIEKQQEAEEKLRLLQTEKEKKEGLPSFEEWLAQGNKMKEMKTLSRKIVRVTEFSMVFLLSDILKELREIKGILSNTEQVKQEDEKKRTRGK